MIGTGFIFGCQMLKICQKQKGKKCPTRQIKKVKKMYGCRWWKLGGIDSGLVSK